MLWPILDRIFDLKLIYKNTEEAIQQRKQFLMERGIGICDIVSSCNRVKIDASDLGMQDIKLRDILVYLEKYTTIHTLLFTGGNSKNGPEYLFRKLCKKQEITLELISNQIPRIHQFKLPDSRKDKNYTSRIIKTVSLTAPSGAANRSIGSLTYYKQKKQKNPNYTTIDFREEQYCKYF
ncbi:uracil-DNA glycosylase family protein [Aquimarina sp. ERC-38]|uniref:uracil-DNA glycosylase family protein n=1 Tax=Aquimarina sp. ERC-38 TaxID=2949996 RepID=UPI002AF6AFFB|nr:uracil-DNA glycosylase family protein [Aquimarina sp. ERC-38]